MYQHIKAITLSFLFFLLLIFSFPIEAQTSSGTQGLRSFSDLFPRVDENIKRAVFSEEGYLDSYWRNKGEFFVFNPSASSGIDLIGPVMKPNPAYLAEAVIMLPYSGKVWDKLDIYNALGMIRKLKGLQYNSYTRDEYVALFEDATRIESAKKTNAIPDPPPAKELPLSETVYMRLKDINFGNSYYQGEVSINPYGLTYLLTNNKNLSYLIFTLIKEENFKAALYMEPLTEGMLIYSIAAAAPTDFAATRLRPSAIEKRLAVFIEWISEGLQAIR